MREDGTRGRVPWIRIGLGGGLAAAAIVAVLPWAPWATPLREILDPWTKRVLLLAALGCAALILPRARLVQERPWRTPEATALAGGAVLVLEPLLILALLGLALWKPLPSLHGLVLPEDGPALSAWLVAAWAIGPAVIEELLFRDRLLPLVAGLAGRETAVTVTAGLFAAAHGGTAPLLVALPLGLVLGLVRLRCRSLYPCVFGHALHNLLALAAGGALIAADWLPATVLLVGVWLATLGWAHHRSGDLRRANRRFAAACTLAMTAAVVLLPTYHALHQRLWAAAAVRLLTAETSDPLVGTRRLAALDRRGLMDEERRDELARALVAADDAPLRHRVWLTVAIDEEGPQRVLDRLPEAPDRCERVLRELLLHPLQGLVVDAVDDIAREHPGAVATFLRHHPPAFAGWYPLRERGGALLDLLAATAGRDRDGLYRLLFQRHPPQVVAALVLRLPPRAVTQRDRYHLRRNHPDPDALIAALARVDLARAVAWGWRE